MKFKQGDKVYIDWLGRLVQSEVLIVYPNTQRYKINQEGWRRIVKERNIYATELGYYTEYLKDIVSQINELQEKKMEIEANLSRLSDNSG